MLWMLWREHCAFDVSVPERSKGVDSSSTVFALVGSNPTADTADVKPLLPHVSARQGSLLCDWVSYASLCCTRSLVRLSRRHVPAELRVSLSVATPTSCPPNHLAAPHTSASKSSSTACMLTAPIV